MKNILLLVHDDAGQEARVQAALDLARALNGHLNCIDVVEIPALIGDFYGAPGQAMLIADTREREDKNRARLEARLAQEDVAWDWAEITADIADGIVKAATLADLIVLNRNLDEAIGPDMHDITSHVVVKARTPVLAVPETLRGFSPARALMAWDGSESCAATMRACTPLFALAEEVAIVTVRDGDDAAEPTEAAQYLSRHGIHATIRMVDGGKGKVDDRIADEAARWRADYVAMGAYGRGRLLEAFGGVTKRMLAKAQVPLLLGH